MRYHQPGRGPGQAPRPVPRSRARTSANGQAPLLVEEVLGFEGFSGNESILYHLHSPCRVKEVGEFDADRARGVGARHARAPAHRHARARAAWATRCMGRRVLQFNDDVEIAICMPRPRRTTSTATARATRSSSSTRAAGVLETIFGSLPYRKHDYVVIPRGTTYRFRFDGPQRWLTFHTPGEIETPEPLPQPLRPAARARAVLAARLPPAGRASRRTRDRGEHELMVRVRGGYQDYVLDYHPFDVVGLGRLRLPVHVQHRRLRAEGRPAAPAAAGAPDLPGPELRHLLVLPAHARLGRRTRSRCPTTTRTCSPRRSSTTSTGSSAPARASTSARSRCTRAACRTARSRGSSRSRSASKRTEELAVMCDTFRPLKLTTLSRDLDDPSYALSWYEEDAEMSPTTIP